MKKVNNQELGKRIYQLRKAAGHTQDDLAALLKQKRQVISYYENGTRTPSVSQLMTIAKEYNTTIDYLLDLTDTQTKDEDLRFVCEYTGLNEQTINFFAANKSNCNDPYFLDEMFEFFELFVARVSQKPTISVELTNLRENTTIYDDLLADFTFNVNEEIAKDTANGVKIEEAIKNAVLDKYGIEKENLEAVKESIDASKYKASKFFNSLIDEFAVSCVEGLTDLELERRASDCYKWGLFI